MFGAIHVTYIAWAQIVLHMKRQSRLVSLQQGNELDRIYAMISLWYFIFRVAAFLVSDTPECRVQKRCFFCYGSKRVYPRNSPARTKIFGVLGNKSLIRRFVV